MAIAADAGATNNPEWMDGWMEAFNRAGGDVNRLRRFQRN
jgi:hypothetical protein